MRSSGEVLVAAASDQKYGFTDSDGQQPRSLKLKDVCLMSIVSGRQRWLRMAIFVGVIYLAVGITSGALAGAVAAEQMRFFWRLSAFVISAVVFAAHISYEHFRLRNAARPTAWHATVAVALGAFALALMANIHDVGSEAGYRPRMLVALVAWPLLTGVPAFVVALLVAFGLGMTHRNNSPGAV